MWSLRRALQRHVPGCVVPCVALVQLAVTLFCVALPHILYAYVWLCSKHFVAVSRAVAGKKDPMDVFARCASAFPRDAVVCYTR